MARSKLNDVNVRNLKARSATYSGDVTFAGSATTFNSPVTLNGAVTVASATTFNAPVTFSSQVTVNTAGSMIMQPTVPTTITSSGTPGQWAIGPHGVASAGASFLFFCYGSLLFTISIRHL